MFQVAEHTAGIQQVENFTVQFTLALMRAVMNREAGNHRIEVPECRQWFIEVMFDDANFRSAGKARSCAVQHGVGEIEGDRFRLGTGPEYDRGQPAITAPDIENAAQVRGKQFEQSGLAFGPVRNRIRAAEVLDRVIRLDPFVDSSHALLY